MTISRENLDRRGVDLSDIVSGRRLPPVHPGRFLRDEFLKPLNLSVYALARVLHVPRPRLNDVMLGRRSVSTDTALRLARYFGTSLKFWVNLQARYDLDVAERKLRRTIDREVKPRAGHRVGTMEVESALVDHQEVAEAAVVGKEHDVKGQAICAFVTLKEGVEASDGKLAELKQHVARKIGAIARPDEILWTADLPKTRSGKIMRRLLRDIAAGKALGDVTTLADPSIVAKLREQYEEKEG